MKLPDHPCCTSCGGCNIYQKEVGPHIGWYCRECDLKVGNWVSRASAGLRPRTTQTTHKGIGNSKRAKILMRANRACELCHKVDSPLHVGHILSVKDGLKFGLTDEEINSDDNLAALCEECNYGVGSLSLPIRLLVALVQARRAKHEGNR